MISEYDNPDNWDAYRYEHCAYLKGSAKLRKLQFNLEPEDLTYPDRCPILDIPITRKLGRANTPTADRVDNSKGYVKGNVEIISFKANLLKSDNSIETLEKLIQYMKGELKPKQEKQT